MQLSRRQKILPLLGFSIVYTTVLAYSLERVFGLWSWLGFFATIIPAVLLGWMVVGFVSRKAEGRPLLSIDFFWNLLAFLLFGITAIIIWAARVTPDHVQFSNEIVIAADRPHVWALISDPLERPRWDRYVEKVSLVSGTPRTVGSIYHFEINATATEVAGDQKIIEVKEPERIAFQILDQEPAGENSVKHLTTTFYLDEIQNTSAGGALIQLQTRLVLETSYDVPETFAKVMTSLIARKFMGDSMEQYLEAIRDIAEGRIDHVESAAMHMASPTPSPSGSPSVTPTVSPVPSPSASATASPH